MGDNICAVCNRRISAHSLEEVKQCTEQWDYVELERTANELCISCGDPSDIVDPATNNYYCHGCFMWMAQLNDESKD